MRAKDVNVSVKKYEDAVDKNKRTVSLDDAGKQVVQEKYLDTVIDRKSKYEDVMSDVLLIICVDFRMQI